MEGASFLQVLRILSGHPLYTQPSIEYIPLIYPPLYFYVSALVAKIMGVGFMPLRLVSVLAFIGCLLFVYRIIELITKNNHVSLIGVGFFAATYPLSGAWFDIARVDTLFVFFCIAAIYFSNKENSERSNTIKCFLDSRHFHKANRNHCINRFPGLSPA